MFDSIIQWFTDYVIRYIGIFLPAAAMTLGVTVLGILVGLGLGIIFALMKLSRLKLLNWPARFYIWVIRGTPLLLQLLLVYFGLAKVIRISDFNAAFIALGVHNGAYIAEILRGAIQSIDRGQLEAGTSLGMTRLLVMRRIIFPQALKRAVPPLSNQFIIALKDSSLASSIAVPELLLRARQLGSSNFMYLEMLTIAGVFYLIMTSILTLVTGRLERKLAVGRERQEA